jgi:hypothetical protein
MSVLFPFNSGILKEATKQQKWTSLFSEQKWTSFVLLLTTIGRTSVPSRFDASSHGCLNSHSVSYDYSESGDSCDDGDGMPVCVCVIQWTRKNLVRGSCKFCEKLRGAAFLACTSFISTCCHRCVVVEGFSAIFISLRSVRACGWVVRCGPLSAGASDTFDTLSVM